MKSAAVMKTVTGPSTRCIHSPAIVTLKSEWEVGFAMMMTMMSYPTRQKERKKKKQPNPTGELVCNRNGHSDSERSSANAALAHPRNTRLLV